MTMGVFVQTNEDSPMATAKPLGYVIQENGCWDWVGATDKDGYGFWVIAGKARRAHRVMYERHKGPIPESKQLDHLCCNPGCINPDHLEPVTPQENTLRGDTPAARNANKTHCDHGHEYTPANTIWRRAPGNRRSRSCRTCELRRGREYEARHPERLKRPNHRFRK